MTSQGIIVSLQKQTEEDYKTARDLFRNRHFHYALFFGQLVLEKLLKALIVKRAKRVYQPIHNLRRLAESAQIKLNPEQKKDFDEITSFNVAARYDDEKRKFYQKATKEFTARWLEKIKNYKSWLEKQL